MSMLGCIYIIIRLFIYLPKVCQRQQQQQQHRHVIFFLLKDGECNFPEIDELKLVLPNICGSIRITNFVISFDNTLYG